MEVKEAIKIFKKKYPNEPILQINESKSYFSIAYGDPCDDDDSIEFIDKSRKKIVSLSFDEWEDDIEILPEYMWK